MRKQYPPPNSIHTHKHHIYNKLLSSTVIIVPPPTPPPSCDRLGSSSLLR